MLKRLSLVLLTLCLLFSFTACGSAPARESESKPADWDMEAEVLRCLNGIVTAKTVEDLRPYVLSETPNSLLEKYIAETNQLLEDYSDAKLDYRDYTYDSVTVTVLETYKGYDILWINASSSSFNQAADALSPTDGVISYVGMPTIHLAPFTVENGHYVASMDETLQKEISSKYDYCQSCGGFGTGLLALAEPCEDCGFLGFITSCVCNDCGETFRGNSSMLYPGMIVVPESEDSSNEETTPNTSVEIEAPIVLVDGLTGFAGVQSCPSCESTNVTATEEPCPTCAGAINTPAEAPMCPTCNGNGWIKK